jgi:hypothetical protein
MTYKFPAIEKNATKMAKRILTSAEVKALIATPIELIPAPGVNKGIAIVNGYALLYNPTNDYSNPFVADLTKNISIRPYFSTHALVFAAFTGTDVSSDTNTMRYFVPSAISESLPFFDNNSVVVTFDGDTEITGNTTNDNNIIIYCLYNIIDIF